MPAAKPSHNLKFITYSGYNIASVFDYQAAKLLTHKSLLNNFHVLEELTESA